MIVARMKAAGETRSVVTLLCDGGDRYVGTCCNDDWLAEQQLDIAPYMAVLNKFAATGEWADE